MSKKIIVISDSCSDCPYHNSEEYYCNKQRIHCNGKYESIPDWCPLEDAEQTGE